MSVTDVGPTRDTFAFKAQHSAIGRVTALAATGDGSRLYAGSFAGVWRSDDGGQNWRQMTWGSPSGTMQMADIPGALFAPNIYDVVISPADADVVLVSALNSQFVDGRDGIYRSADGGATWTMVLDNPYPCNIAFAPDDPSLVFAATGYYGVSMSTNGGVVWTTVSTTRAWHVAVGPMEPGGVRRVYAVGDSVVSYSSDGGVHWTQDAGVATINASRAALDALRLTCDPNDTGIGGFGGSTDITFAQGAGAKMLAIEPGTPARVYMATEGAANGPTYYDPAVPDGTLCNTVCARLAGEASVWLGDFSQFSTMNPMAQWTSLPGPPVYYGGSTPSGVTMVLTKPTSTGFLLFFTDFSHVHVSAGTPAATTSWHRLDGEDVSVAYQAGHHNNILYVHVDPHGIAFTNNFEIKITPATGVSPPYNQNSVLSQYIGGTLWMANDGGVNWCSDGGQNANSWNWPLGLNTLDPVNIAGLFGIGDTPALYFGCGDNDDFFTLDGGGSWGDPGDNCGDCDAWFTDIATADRVIQFLPRANVVGIIVSSNTSQYPDASDNANKTFVPSTQIISAGPPAKLVPYPSSGWVLQGYRPIVKTLATEAALPDGDYLFVNQDLNTGVATLLRTTAIRSILQVSDWLDPSKASPVGPALPTNAFVVQAGGGHFSTVFYVGDGNNASGSVWKLDASGNTWNQIIPTGPAPVQVGFALSWFVNPYDPDEIYVLDYGGVKASIDGGQSWFNHIAMTNAVTAGEMLSISSSLLQDMQFSRGEHQTRFVVGRAGVSYSMDFGVTWFPVLNSIAIPGIPESGFFDPISNPEDRAFYVECQGRSVLRIGELPALSPPPPPPIFDLMEFAALDY